MLKRLFDFTVALAGLFVFLPFAVLIVYALLLSNGLPVFFLQERVGKEGRRFNLIKFRSMKKSIEPYPVIDLLEDDPRVSKIGKFLRSIAMDELPQLINILKGDMSFVGPKPLPFARQDEEGLKYKTIEDIPGYKKRSKVIPGLTGLAQVYSPKKTTNRNKFRYDSIYIDNRSMFLDLWIILTSFYITLNAKWESSRRGRH